MTLRQSRRSFLKTSSALAAACSVLGTGSRFFPSEPNLQFPTEPRARLGVASWPFREFIESPTNKWARNPKKPGMDLTEFGAMVVKRFGLHNIEPLSSHFRSTDPAYLRELRLGHGEGWREHHQYSGGSSRELLRSGQRQAAEI